MWWIALIMLIVASPAWGARLLIINDGTNGIVEVRDDAGPPFSKGDLERCREVKIIGKAVDIQRDLSMTIIEIKKVDGKLVWQDPASLTWYLALDTMFSHAVKPGVADKDITAKDLVPYVPTLPQNKLTVTTGPQ